MSNISRLNLNSTTRLDELQNFALNLNDKDRVRTERTSTGIVLYASPKPTGLAKAKESVGNFVARFTSPNRNREVREAVSGVLQRSGGRADAAVFSSVQTALQSGLKGEMKGASLKMLAAAMRPDDGMKGPATSRLSPGTIPQVADMVLSGLESLHAADGASAGFSSQPIIGIDLVRLGADMARDFAKGATQADKDSFVLTGAPATLRALEDAMVDALPAPPSREMLAQIKDAAAEVVRHTAAALADGRKAASGDITIGGKTYELERHLGQGGFGSVDLYREKGGTEQIAVKSAIRATSPEARKEIRDEVDAHRAASGSPNVVNLKGTVLGEDGSLSIAMEYAPKGDVSCLLKALGSDTTLTRAERNVVALTILRDLAVGMEHMHGTADLVHADFRPTNCFISASGTAKIADFGTTKKTADYSFGNAAIKNGGSSYTSPEYSADGDKAFAAANRFKRPTLEGQDLVVDQAKVDHLANQIDERFRGKGLSGAQREVLGAAVRRNIAEAGQESGVDSTRHGKTGDVWALGATAFALIFGRGASESASSKHPYKNFGLDTTHRAVDSSAQDVTDVNERYTLDTSFLAGTSGDPVVDDLLNTLLHPDPSQRPSMSAVLAHPAIRGLTAQDEATARARISSLV